MPSTDVEQSGSGTGGPSPSGADPATGRTAQPAPERSAQAPDDTRGDGRPRSGGQSGSRGRLQRLLPRPVRVRLGTAKRRALRVTRVRYTAWDTVEVSIALGLRRARYHLGDAGHKRELHAPALSVRVPDPASLDRLAASGLLRGHIHRLTVHVTTMPRWLSGGLRFPRTARDSTSFSWRTRGAGADITISWRKPHPVAGALGEVATALLRPGRWDQAGGPVYAAGRADWLRGRSTWPHAVLGAAVPAKAKHSPKASQDGQAEGGQSARTEEGTGQAGTEQLGPFSRPPAGPAPVPRLVLAVANPHGRRMLGRATAYVLSVIDERVELRTAEGAPVLRFDSSHSVEQTLLSSTFDKYAVATCTNATAPDPTAGVPHVIPNSGSPFVRSVLESLGACGLVFAAEAASDLNLVTVSDPAMVDDLAGYQLSAAATRRAVIGSDPAVRRSTLAGGPLPVPAISVVIASKRPDDIETCLADLARQTYPSYEILLGTHGYDLDERLRRELEELLPVPLRVVPIPGDRTLGEILGTLSRKADGELISKVDDDDRYGPDHLTDLFIALRCSGADLVAKAPRFVHFADEGYTVDRTWAAPEAFAVAPAGGTMLLSRGSLQAAGGWSTSARHVDADLLARVGSIGGLSYRTHGLGYVYTRRTSGHTWQANPEDLSKDGEVLYESLPTTILAGNVST